MKIKANKKPYIPYESWSIEYNNPIKEVDLSKLSLHLEPEQKDGYIKGEILSERLKEKSLNANVLDYLIENPTYIPENWKKDEKGNTKYIYFWGTIYRSSGGSLYVRCLYWDDVLWDWSDRWLGNDFGASRPAASLASSSLNSVTESSLDPLSLELAIEKVKKAGYKIIKEI